MSIAVAGDISDSTIMAAIRGLHSQAQEEPFPYALAMRAINSVRTAIATFHGDRSYNDWPASQRNNVLNYCYFLRNKLISQETGGIRAIELPLWSVQVSVGSVPAMNTSSRV
jgi:hypothetical protein